MRLIVKGNVYTSVDDFYRRFGNSFVLLEDDTVYYITGCDGEYVCGKAYTYPDYEQSKWEARNIKVSHFAVKEIMFEPRFINEPLTDGTLRTVFLRGRHDRQQIQGASSSRYYTDNMFQTVNIGRGFLPINLTIVEAIQNALVTGGCAMTPDLAVIFDKKKLSLAWKGWKLPLTITKENGLDIPQDFSEIAELANLQGLW